MSDLIRRQDVIDVIKQFSTDNIRLRNGLMELANHMELIPSVDAVPVVWCKDCRFHEQEQPGMVYCPATVGGWVEENWFCKGGERRGE